MSTELANQTLPRERPLLVDRSLPSAEKATPNPLVFFETIFANMRTKIDVDWETVAEKAHYKSGAIARIRFNTIIRQLRGQNAISATPKTPPNSQSKKRAPRALARASKRSSPQSHSRISSEVVTASPPEVVKKDTAPKKAKLASTSKRVVKTKPAGKRMVKDIKVEADKMFSRGDLVVKDEPMDEGVSFDEVDMIYIEKPVYDKDIAFRGVERLDFEESDVQMSQ